MGCFCRDLIPTPDPDPTEDEEDSPPPETPPVLEAVSTWLSRRWLPAPQWQPDEEWLEVEWPEPPVTQAAIGTLLALADAARRCELTLGIDLFLPGADIRLRRVVATLNARTEALAELEERERPWTQLLQLNTQAELVEKAVAQGLFQHRPDPEPIAPDGPWRPVLLRVKALAPLVALGQLLRLDWTAPDVLNTLTLRIRTLARIILPPLAEPTLVLKLIAQLDAVARLKESFGADPRPAGYHRVRRAVERRAAEAAERLPDVRLEDGELVGMPQLPPNPFHLLNPQTVKLARQLTPDLLDRMTWQVPSFERLTLLTIGNPVAVLTETLGKLGTNPVRQTPCGRDCDAARLTRALAPAADPASTPPGTPRPGPDHPAIR